MKTITIPSNVNKDLLDERNKVNFNVEEFTNFYFGGADKVAFKRELEKHLLSDPELNLNLDTSYLSYKEKYEEAVRRSVIVHKKLIKLILETDGGQDDFMKTFAGFQRIIYNVCPEGDPLMLHFSMFAFTMMNLTTDEQKMYWLPRIVNCEVLGTYAQTELGHGTYLKKLETTATYDPKTKEFILDSPTLTSLKWWPGNLGHTSNYAVVMAQLFTQGNSCGIHPFIVQLRDEETHKHLPGITTGDIGNKFAFGTVNNGFLKMDKIRIPLKSMLMKNAQVLEDGTFVKAQNTKLNYGTMMLVRVGMVNLAAAFMAKSVTIATRYSLVRRQSPINPNEPEPKIIEHVTQQYKIFPAIAKSIVFKIVADNLTNLREEVALETERGDMERLPELHAVICCLKAVCGLEARDSIETCRLSTGGHGYLYSAGFHEMYKYASVLITGEGENTVLLLQTGRYLLKAFEKAQKGEKLTAGVNYLAEFLKGNGKRIFFDDSLRGMLRAVQTATAGRVATSWKLINEKKKTLSIEQATNEAGIEITKAAHLHGLAFLLQTAIYELEIAMKNSSEAFNNVLKNILELFAVDMVLNMLGDILMFVDITSEDIEKLQKRLENSLAFFRTSAIGIVDGLDFSDQVLSSTLGAYDGNVYERLFEAAKKSPLNQEDVNKSFHLYLKPFMKSNL